MTTRQRHGVALGTLVAFAATGAHAQGPASGAERIGLEEVIVTAQKREESLQDVPISIAAIGEQQLDKLGIRSLKDFAGNVPNLFVNNFNARPDTIRLFIRGIGQNDVSITQDPSVALYMDGVYIGTSVGAAFESADIERIEVLRGPQGTLYGRNATGGAVNLVTKKPTGDAVAGQLDIAGGNYGYKRASGAINVPLGGTVAMRLSGLYNQRDGWIANNGPGEDFGSQDRRAGRLALRWRATDSFTADYAYDVSKFGDSGTLTDNTAGAGNTLAFLGAPSATAYIPGVLSAPIGTWTYTNAPFTGKRPSSVTSPRTILPNDTKVQGHSLTLEWLTSETLTVRSITGWRKVDSKLYADNLPLFSGTTAIWRLNPQTFAPVAIVAPLGGPFPASESQDSVDYKNMSEELQALGDVKLAGGGKLSYVGGLYFYKDDGQFDRVSNSLGPRGQDFSSVSNKSYAVYADLTWTPAAFGERLHLSAGGRWSKDKREAYRISEASFSFAALGGFTAENCVRFRANFAALGQTCSPTGVVQGANYSRDFSKFSPSAIVRYDLTDAVNVYAKYVRGYKSGGTSQRSANPLNFAAGFEPEKVDSIELGMKGSFLDRRLTANIAVFDMKFDAYQASLQTGGTPGDRDFYAIDGSKIKGVELELAAAITQNLRAHANLGYLDTKFGTQSVTIRLDTGALSTTNFIKPFSYAPKRSATVGFDYDRPVASGWNFGSYVNWNYQSSMETSSNAADNLPLDARGLVDAGLSLTREDFNGKGADLSFRLWGKNLGDKEYKNLNFSSFAFFGSAAASEWGEPRTYGLTVGVKF